MQLFYSEAISSDSSIFVFDKEESKHIVRVLRKKAGDTLLVTNGQGSLFEVKITMDSDKKCMTEIIKSECQPPKDYHIHLAVAPTKMNDRFEWFLEKATEIGIQEITPIICEHSERRVVKTERWNKILQAAMKQSLQAYLPRLNAPISFRDFVEKNFNAQRFIAHCADTEKNSIHSLANPKNSYLLLIGPEGDFSKDEIELALSKGFQPVTLGTTRLRTETAAVVATHSFTLINEV